MNPPGGVFAVQFASAAAALAVVGLGEIGEFEICREGLRHLVGAGQIHRGDNFLRLEHEFGQRRREEAGSGLARAFRDVQFRDVRSAAAATLRPKSNSSRPDCSTRACPRIAPSERTSRRSGLSFAGSSELAVSSARRACWSSAFHSGLGLFDAI